LKILKLFFNKYIKIKLFKLKIKTDICMFVIYLHLKKYYNNIK